MKSRARGRLSRTKVFLVVLTSAAATLRRGKLTAQEEWPSCSCDCCNVAERRPDEVVAAVGVKCAPSDEHSEDLCASQCTVDTSDRVLARLVVGDALDYQRFCFFECKPADGLGSPLRTQCVALEAADVQLVVSSSGEALDPAVVYGRSATQMSKPTGVLPPVSLLAARSGAAVATRRQLRAMAKDRAAPTPGGPTNEEAQQVVFDGSQSATTQTQETIRELKLTAEYESALNTRKRTLGADPYASITDLRSATLAAQTYESSAEQAARNAERTLALARGENTAIAENATYAEVAKVREETRAKALAAETRAQGAAIRKA